jgi:hypothetical protein
MTINDVAVNERCILIRRLAEATQVLQRDGKELALFIALSDIERAAHDAQARLNEMRFATNPNRP